MKSATLRGAGMGRVVTASDIEVTRERRLLHIAITLCAMPVLVFVVLRWFAPGLDPFFRVPDDHFVIVSAACLGALVLALVLSLAAVQAREPRIFFLASTYLAIAAPFSVHGLMTTGHTFSGPTFHITMSVSAQLSLILGAIFIMLASRPLRPSLDRLIREQFGPLMWATVLVAVGYIVICLTFPNVLDWMPTGSEASGDTTILGLEKRSVGWAIRLAILGLGVILTGTAATKFYRSFATTRSFATGAVALSAVMIGESLFVQTFGVVWYTSWWLYHGLLFLGVMLPMTGFALLYRRGSSLIEIVDSLMLTETLAKVEYSMPSAIDDFIQTVEKRDPYLRGHVRRVCELTVEIAEVLSVPDSTLRAASYAALLHDIGKLGLPLSLLNRAERLEPAEFELLREHPARGFALVANIESLRTAAPAIRWHHERMDGTGYPDGLIGEEIPIEARIVAVADVWDALTSDRAYRGAMSDDEARAILTNERAVKLDAACVDALFAVVDLRSQTQRQPEPVEFFAVA